MKTVLGIMLLLGCSGEPPRSLDARTSTRTLGTFELHGSRCELTEVNLRECERCEWEEIFRMAVCDPPVAGACGGPSPRKDPLPQPFP